MNFKGFALKELKLLSVNQMLRVHTDGHA